MLNLSFLQGKKTYLAVLALVFTGLGQLINGDTTSAFQSFSAALVAFGFKDHLERIHADVKALPTADVVNTPVVDKVAEAIKRSKERCCLIFI